MKTGIRCDEYQKFENEYQASKSYLWGVSSGSAKDITHIEMTVKAAEGEEFIVRRLEREKRNADGQRQSQRRKRDSRQT